MIIKYASKEDVEAISAVERECFPPSEAATEKEFVERVKHYVNHFWLMYEAEKLIAFVDGFVTDEYDLTDEMYENAAMHNENGAWQMIFGVNTLPDIRKLQDKAKSEELSVIAMMSSFCTVMNLMCCFLILAVTRLDIHLQQECVKLE